MRKLTLTLVMAATALLAAACRDATEPGPGTKPEFDVGGSDFQCVGAATGSFDNVVVPPGAFCSLTNSTVKGNVKALENSILFMSSTTVGGNVEGDKAEVVQVLAGTMVAGNVIIKEGEFADPLFDVAICGTTVGGNVEVAKMTGAVVMGGVPGLCPNQFRGNLKIEENLILHLDINLNSIAQNMQVFKNRGAGTKLIFSNTVGQNLQCFENDPPFVGGPNTAGKAEGQCF